MIINPRVVPLAVPLIDEMQHSLLAFHPTGSRFIGGFHDTSDWDFVAQDTPEFREWLKNRRAIVSEFRTMSENGNEYHDGFTAMVFTAYTCGHKIQVQLTPNLHAKLYARNQIKSRWYEQHLQANTEERCRLWNTLCKEWVSHVASVAA